MLHHGPRSAPPYLRPLKKKGFKEERVTTMGLDDLGKSTTLESNKSLARLPLIVQRRSSQAILEQGEHPALLQACPHLIKGMMPIENRQEQRFYTTATREDMRGVWRAEGINKGSDVELADDPQHQWQVGHRTDVLNSNGHEVPLLQSF